MRSMRYADIDAMSESLVGSQRVKLVVLISKILENVTRAKFEPQVRSLGPNKIMTKPRAQRDSIVQRRDTVMQAVEAEVGESAAFVEQSVVLNSAVNALFVTIAIGFAV